MPVTPHHKLLFGFSLDDTVLSSFFSCLCRELAARSHEAKALVWPASKGLAQGDGGVKLVGWPSSRPTRLADAWFLWKELRSYRPDGIIANFASVNLMTSLGWLEGVSVRAIHYHTLSAQLALDTPHGPIRGALLRARKNLIYRLATHLIASSRAAAADAAGGYQAAKGKCVVQYFGLLDPCKKGTPEVAGTRPLRLICPGRLCRSKGQDILIKALPELVRRFKGLEIEFLGDGPQRCSLEGLAAELRVADACHFRGALPHPAVLEALAQARAAVVPSLSESFGLVNIECLSLGTPVVASKVGGIPEIIREGQDGFLVPPGVPEALQARLTEMLADVELCSIMGGKARERFLSAFEAGRCARAYADWLEGELDRCWHAQVSAKVKHSGKPSNQIS